MAANAEYQKQSALLKKRNKAYNEFCEQNDLKKRSERIAIAKWDRSQAEKARAAARKAEKSVAKSENGDKITTRRSDIQFFANKSIQKQSGRALKKSMKSWESRMEEHIMWLSNPKLHDRHWDEKTPQHQVGLLKHWQHEIETFRENIKEAKTELKKRGDYDDV